MIFQEQLNYEISNMLTANSDYLVRIGVLMEPKSLHLDGWNLDGWNLDGWSLDGWSLDGWRWVEPRWMEPKSRQLIASLPLEMIDRWPPSAYRNSLLGSGFALETNAREGCASVQTRE